MAFMSMSKQMHEDKLKKTSLIFQEQVNKLWAAVVQQQQNC